MHGRGGVGWGSMRVEWRRWVGVYQNGEGSSLSGLVNEGPATPPRASYFQVSSILSLYIFEKVSEDSVVVLVKCTFSDALGNLPLISQQITNITLYPLSDENNNKGIFISK